MTTMEPTSGHLLRAADGEHGATSLQPEHPVAAEGRHALSQHALGQHDESSAGDQASAPMKGSPDPNQGTDRYRLVTPFTLRL